MTAHPPIPSVVVYVNGAPYHHPATVQTGHASGHLSGHLSTEGRYDRLINGADQARSMVAKRPYDPHRVHRDFPARWQAYIRASFRNISHVTQVFEVSERTARKWWAGETGAVGGHVAIAVNEHPDIAPTMLFAAE